MVCGSAHQQNREQARVLAAERGVAIHELALDRADLARDAVAKTLRAEAGAILMIEERRHESAVVVRAMAEAVAQLVASARVPRVFVTGGETAFALCSRLGISALTFCTEIEPGLSLSWGEAAQGRIALAIKPGGFGDRQTWVRAWDALRGA